ncbi:MAG: ABC transporter ATP-binding protein [Deltaproteobacteria bacterium]|nr:ABC transporter ATP-binding protein [Deltaproteobacteria bacterium]
MLQVTDLAFRYRKQMVLKDVCLESKRGQILGILGPNGVGKSTLLKCMLHILKPTGGSVTIGQEDVRHMSPLKRAKLLAYVPQAYPSKFPMTVFDAVLVGRRPYLSWRPSHEDITKVTEVLRLMDLEPLASRDFDCLSGGQKQKVMLARAFVQEASYLLLDEPTSNLDVKHQLEVMELLQETVSQDGVGVVVAMHDLNMAQRFSDEVLVMNGGGVFARGKPCDVLNWKNIGAVFGVEVEQMKGNNGSRCWYPVRPFQKADRG